jgi:hypothetical protein
MQNGGCSNSFADTLHQQPNASDPSLEPISSRPPGATRPMVTSHRAARASSPILIGSPQRWDRRATLTSTLHWFRAADPRGEPRWVDGGEPRRDRAGRDAGPIRPRRARHGFQREPGAWQQEGSAYNGHFESVGYHLLFLFNDHRDCLRTKLRRGNVSSADDWEELLGSRLSIVIFE